MTRTDRHHRVVRHQRKRRSRRRRTRQQAAIRACRHAAIEQVSEIARADQERWLQDQMQRIADARRWARFEEETD